jgi:DNA-binding NarL/FixJ family response regulator
MADRFDPGILVVDDEELLREALCAMLTNHGFRVLGQAGSGQEAVELAEELRPDVVIMDFRMAGMDGVEAIDRIRTANPSTQAIMFTAFEDPALSMDASRVGAISFIVKGSDPALILQALRGITRGEQAPSGLGRGPA